MEYELLIISQILFYILYLWQKWQVIDYKKLTFFSLQNCKEGASWLDNEMTGLFDLFEFSDGKIK